MWSYGGGRCAFSCMVTGNIKRKPCEGPIMGYILTWTIHGWFMRDLKGPKAALDLQK